MRLAPLINNVGGTPYDTAATATTDGVPSSMVVVADAETRCTVVGQATIADGRTPAPGGIALRAAFTAIRVQSFVVYQLGP